MLIQVMLSRALRGISHVESLEPLLGTGKDGRLVESKLQVMDFQDLLKIRFECDAHFTPYRVVGAESGARLRKEALGNVRALGGEVACSVVVLDLDLHHLLKRKSKVPWTEVDVEEVLSGMDTPLPVTWFYTTRHGARFVHALSQDVPAGASYEALVRRFHKLYRDAGIPVDLACKDWTHIYRAPMVTLEDGTTTWEQPWFRYVEDLDEFYVPEPEDLVPAPEEARVVAQTVTGSQPDDDAALAMVRDGDKLTPMAKAAEKLLRESGIHPYIFSGVPFARGGTRHSKLTQVAGIVVSAVRSIAESTPEFAYALVREATKLLDDDEDWAGKAWEMVTSFWSRDGSQIAPSPGSQQGTDTNTAAAEPGEADLLQQEQMAVDKDGKPYSSSYNVRIAIGLLGASVRYDEFSDRILVSGLDGFGPYLNDHAVTRLRIRAKEELGLARSRDDFHDDVVDLALRARFHPVKDYVDSLKWDGTRRVDTWLSTYMGVSPDEFTQAIGRIFLVAAVRRIRQPGCKFDEMLLLEGTQGQYKSSAIKALCADETWFSDDLPLGAEAKVVIEQTAGKWIIEAAELVGISRKAAVSELKNFLSRSHDRGRMAYDRIVTERPRQFVVIGTTNMSAYLKDTTGNRRYWPVAVSRVDVEALKRDRDQLWAEAAHLEAEGSPTRLDPALYKLETEHQELRRIEEPFFDKLQDVLGDATGRIRVSCVRSILNLNSHGVDHDSYGRMTSAMERLGWVRKTMRVEEGVKNCFTKGDGAMLWKAIKVNDDTHKLKEVRRMG